MAMWILLLSALLTIALKTTPVLGRVVLDISCVVLATLRRLRLVLLVISNRMLRVFLTSVLSSGEETVTLVVATVCLLFWVELTFTRVDLVLVTMSPMLVKLRPTRLGAATRLATFEIFRSRIRLVRPNVLTTETAWLVSVSSWLPGTMTRALILLCSELTLSLVRAVW